MLSVDPALTPEKVEQYLKASCFNIESLQNAAHQGKVGAGRINAFAAVTMVTDSISPITANFTCSGNYINTYKFYYGSLDISLNTELEKTFTDYVVSEPYPNPFNPAQSTFTSISIKSMGNENLTIKIIDPLGQQVGYYNSITIDDENRFDWYGTNERGVPLASGVYYFLIDLNSKQYSRNLVLLR